MLRAAVVLLPDGNAYYLHPMLVCYLIAKEKCFNEFSQVHPTRTARPAQSAQLPSKKSWLCCCGGKPEDVAGTHEEADDDMMEIKVEFILT